MLFLLLVSWLFLHTAWGYNFDTNVPLIVKSGVDETMLKTKGFGFSVTQHEFPDGRKM